MLNNCAMNLGAPAADAEELREPQIDVRERRTVDRTDRRETPRGAERVDGVEIQIAAAGSRQHPGGRSPVSVSLFKSPAELDGLNGRLDRKSPIADTCMSSGRRDDPARPPGAGGGRRRRRGRTFE